MIKLLIKNDDFLLGRYLKKLLQDIAPESSRDFGFDRVSAKTEGLQKILNCYKTAPLLAESRTVVVDDFDELDKNELDVLLKNLDPKQDDSHLILIGEKIDKRTAFYKSFSKIAEIVEFKKPYANQMPQFLITEAKAMGLNLSSTTAQILVDTVGTDMPSLIQELEKLQIAIMPRKEITAEDVKKFVANGILENIFDLTQALAEKNLRKSSQLFERFYEQGEPLIRTVSLVLSHFRKLRTLKSAQNMNLREPPEKLLGVHPFFVKDYLRQVKSFDTLALQKIYTNLMSLSESLRSSFLAHDTLFADFLQKVCGVERR